MQLRAATPAILYGERLVRRSRVPQINKDNYRTKDGADKSRSPIAERTHSSHRGVCAFLAGFERVFHPLHHRIELVPLDVALRPVVRPGNSMGS
jgi:hypothetical protein